MNLHFLSGLPRSGSTLLASLLRQHPDAEASIMSPVGRLVTDCHMALSGDNEASGFITDDQRAWVLRGVIEGYYRPVTKQTVVDNNRRWCANLSLLKALYPSAKVLCCVRSPAAIVDSFERLFAANPLQVSAAIGYQSNLTVYDRVGLLLDRQAVLGFALNAFREAFYGPHRAMLRVINYDDLCRFPAEVMRDVTEALELSPFEYDFDHIQAIPGVEEFDKRLHMPGLHALKPKVEYTERTSILPPDVFNALPKSFWLGNKAETKSS